MLETTYPDVLTAQEIVVGLCAFFVLGFLFLFRNISIFRPIWKVVMTFFVVLGLKFGWGYFTNKNK